MNRSYGKYLPLSCCAILIGFLLFGTVAAKSKQPVVNRVVITGNSDAGRDQIIEQLHVRKGAVLPAAWPEPQLTGLIQWYHDQGYYNMKIDTFKTGFNNDSSRVDLFLKIIEGEQVKIGRIRLKNLKLEEEKTVRRLINSQANQSFNASRFKQDMEEVLTYWEDHGHPLCQTEIQRLTVNDMDQNPRLEITVFVDKGTPVYIGGINVRGNRLTKKSVILRETRLRLGNLYRHYEIKSAQSSLRRLGYFRNVSEPDVIFIQDQAYINFSLQEGNTNTIDGVIGYHPPVSDEKSGYWTGRLQFAFRNLFGTGRFLDVYWEKKDAYSQAMRFGYEEPWLLGWPVHIGGQFQQEIRDTTYIERDWLFSFRYVPWSSLSLDLKCGQRSVLPDSLGSVLYNLAQTSTWRFMFGFQYHTMDDPWNPRKGVTYRTTVTLGRKHNIGPDFIIGENWKETVHTRQLDIDAESAIPLFNRQVLYFGLHGTEVRTGDETIPISDQVRFGGARSLRGYSEDLFRGSLVAWLNSEYRFLLGRRSRVFLFVDSGLYQRKEESERIEGFKVGVGFGIRLETRVGLFGIDYGLGEGDSLLQGKVHVGLVNWF